MKRFAGRIARPSRREASRQPSWNRTGAAARMSTRVFAAAAMALAAPLTLTSFSTHAADMNAVNNAARIGSSVGAGSAVPSLGVGAVLQTVFGLLVVIGLVFACAWLARRFGLQPGNRGGLVKTIGGASLGGKERVAVVEIGDTWLVLGAAPGNVRLLHTMPAGSTVGAASPGEPAQQGMTAGGISMTRTAGTASAPLPGTFGQRFREALKGEVGKRFNRRDGGDQ